MHKLLGTYNVVSGPVDYIHSLETTKQWLRQTDNGDDALIEMLVTQSFHACEDDTGHPYGNYTLATTVPTSWQVQITSFPVDAVTSVSGLSSGSYYLRHDRVGNAYVCLNELPASPDVTITFTVTGDVTPREKLAVLKGVVDEYEQRSSQVDRSLSTTANARESLLNPTKPFLC